MIETVLLDLGKVLVDFSHERMFGQIGALCDKSPDQIRQLLFSEDLYFDFERGKLTEGEFHTHLEDRTGARIDPEELYRAGSDIFELNADMVPVLSALRAGGYRMVLLSNTCIAHFRFVRENFEVLDYMADFVLSYQVGASKPDPEIYLAALERIGCEPNNCFYTDDILKNVTAARQFGIRAEVFTDVQSFACHLRDLGVELPGLPKMFRETYGTTDEHR